MKHGMTSREEMISETTSRVNLHLNEGGKGGVKKVLLSSSNITFVILYISVERSKIYIFFKINSFNQII